MRRKISLLIIIISLPFLGGCGGMRSQYKNLEELLVIQSMGLDREDDNLLLSLAPAAESGKGNVCLSGSGHTVSAAMERVRSHSFEGELFCAHVNHILLGREMAERGIEELLSYVCHSPELRIDLPLYIIKNGSARELILGAGSSGKDVTELMDALRGSLTERGDSRVTTAAEIIAAQQRNGSCLICALEYAPAAEQSGEETSDSLKTAAVSGYAVIKDYKLAHFIDSRDAVAVGFLTDRVGLCEIGVTDEDGNRVMLELDKGSADISPVLDGEGRLCGIDVQVKASFSVLEGSGTDMDFNSAQYADRLVARLEEELSDRIASVLMLSKSLRADFLGLSGRLGESWCPPGQKPQELFLSLLPSLELRLSVKGSLSHTSDLKDA